MSQKFLQNLVGALIRVGIGIAVIPFYIKIIGTERFGILSLVWVMLGYLSVFDLGMSASSINALARVDRRDVAQMGRIFATAILINTSLGFVGSVLIAFVGIHVLLSVHALSPNASAELQNARLWIALMLPTTLASGIATGALDAHERFLASNIMQVTSNALSLLIPLIAAAILNPSLPTVMSALLLTRIVAAAAMISFNVFEFGSISVLKFDNASARKLFSFGGWVSVTSLLSELMTSLDQFLIGGVLGVKSVAFYSVPMNAGLRLQLFSSTLARTLFPSFSRTEQHAALYSAQGALVSLTYLSTLVYAPTLAVLTPLLTLWLGNSFANSALHVAPILFFGAWVNGLTIISYSLIQAQGRPDLVAKAHMCEVLPYFALLWLFVHWLGIFGVALAWSARGAADFVILWAISKMPFQVVFRLLPSLLLVTTGFLINLHAASLSWVMQFASGMTLFTVALILWTFLDPRATEAIRFLKVMFQ